MSDEVVYLIQAGPHYKLGHTRNLKHRLGILQTSQAWTLVAVRTWETPQAAALEAYLKIQLLDYCVRGEMYTLDDFSVVDTAVDEWFEHIRPRINLSPNVSTRHIIRMPSNSILVGSIHPLMQWRARYGVTQGQMAKACEVSQGQLSKIERFQQLPLRDLLERLRSYTGLPTDAFIRPRQFLDEQPNFLAETRPPNQG